KHADLAAAAVELARVHPDKPEEYGRGVDYLQRCVALALKDAALTPARRQAAVDEYAKRMDQLVGGLVRRGVGSPHFANGLARKLVTFAEPAAWLPSRAVELAEKAVKQAPFNAENWNTLGVARYRVGDWPAAEAALRKSMELLGGNSLDWYF